MLDLGEVREESVEQIEPRELRQPLGFLGVTFAVMLGNLFAAILGAIIYYLVTH